MPVAAVIAVFSGFIGLAVLFLLGVESFRRIRALGRTVARSSERIAAAGATSQQTGQSADAAESNVW